MSKATDQRFPFDHRTFTGGNLKQFLAEQREIDRAREKGEGWP